MTERRLWELEEKVRQLEEELQRLSKEVERQKQEGEASLCKTPEAPKTEDWVQIPVPPHIQGRIQRFEQEPVEMAAEEQAAPQPALMSDTPPMKAKAKKDGESLIGKYLVGILASVLVFIGAASFIAIVWNLISPEMKVGIVCVLGIILTGIGVWMSVKKSTPISSIILGTGSGLVYIGIFSAGIVLKMLDYRLVMFLSLLWLLALLVSYRYTQLFFTVIIAYIGSYINLVFAAQTVGSLTDALLLWTAVTIISVAMLYCLRKDSDAKYTTIICLSVFSYISMWVRLWNVETAVSAEAGGRYMYLIYIAAVAAVFALKYLLYQRGNKRSLQPLYLLLALVSTISFVVLLLMNIKPALLLPMKDTLLIFFIFALLQFLANAAVYRNLGVYLRNYYTLVFYLAGLALTAYCFDEYLQAPGVCFAAGLVIAVLVLQKKLWALPFSKWLGLILLGGDTLILLSVKHLWALPIVIINLALLFVLPLLGEKEEKELSFKNASVLVLLANAFLIGRIYGEWQQDTFAGFAVGLALMTALLFALYFGKYYREYMKEEENLGEAYYVFLAFVNGIYFAAAIGIIWLEPEAGIYAYLAYLSLLLLSLLQHNLISWKGSGHFCKTEALWLAFRFLLYPIKGIWGFAFGLLHFAAAAYIRKNRGALPKTFALRVLTLAMLIVGYYFLMTDVRRYDVILSMALLHSFALALSVGSLYLAHFSGFLEIRQEGEEDADEKPGIWRSGSVLIVFSVLLYVAGLLFLFTGEEPVEKCIVSLSLVALLVFQGHMMYLRHKKVNDENAVVLLLQFLALTWVFIYAFASLSISSVVYSVSALLLAVCAIYAGFRYSAKLLRHFGLGITLLMVAKFILVDLSGENSIIRVLSFVAGGVLCFIISLIYNRLSKN